MVCQGAAPFLAFSESDDELVKGRPRGSAAELPGVSRWLRCCRNGSMDLVGLLGTA